ncbi:MAG: GDSL-type esterase/lipase family protein [Anaeroplasma bactoclasticum]|nr:GDSL-type esterase/lipase family protein [Staphylococcus sp.]MCM1350814.1 GDSL-type esterase/lipase family protein [Prevotella sp.]MCM1513888.1 GDSL-type esterase/lipase family protein [Anaeroplasma bactoclasticum]
MEIKKKSTILFLGDCITGADRNLEDPNDLGHGYVARINDALKNYRIKIVNRGLDGNRTLHLLEQYEENVLQVQPDFITIYIGMNDVWHHYSRNIETSNIAFEQQLRTLLEKIKQDLNVPILIIEPFIIDITPELTKMREELWQKVDIIRKLAREYASEYVALDGSFASACIKHEPTFYSIDGVHPTEEGHKFIARRWLRNVIVED